MNTAMRWSVLLIMVIYALGSGKAQDSTSSARCRLPPITAVGQHIRIQFLLSSDPKIDEKDVHISKVPDGTSICEPRNKEEFIIEAKFNVTTKDIDSYTREGYIYGGIDKERLLTIFIEKVGPQHEGMYMVEESKDSYVCYLKVLDTPPSTQIPETSTDGVKDSWAVAASASLKHNGDTDSVRSKRAKLGDVKNLEDKRFFTMHEEDRNAWFQVTRYLIAGMIVTVIASTLCVSFFGYLYYRTAASKKKTGKKETNDSYRSRQEETTDEWNESEMPSGGNILQLRGLGKQRADTGSCAVETAADDESSDHRAGNHSTRGQRGAAASSMPLLDQRLIKGFSF